MLNTLISIVLMLHGLVHIWYIVLAQGWVEFQADMGWTGSSWLFSSWMEEGMLVWLATICYGLSAAGFFVAGAGSLGNQEWSRPWLIGSALFSSLILILFWDGRPGMLVEKGLLGLLINLAVLIYFWAA